MGAWIETCFGLGYWDDDKVAPYVGAWIETSETELKTAYPKSHPTWVRGLKLIGYIACRKINFVAPYVGAWIETVSLSRL